MRNWKGSIMVDIREFYVKDGKQLPGRKGYYSLLSNAYSLFFLSVSEFILVLCVRALF